MFRFILKLTLSFLLILTVSGFTVRALSSLQPSSPALRGFGEGCAGKPLPCWYGIAPGMTNYWDAKKQLKALGFSNETIQRVNGIEFGSHFDAPAQSSLIKIELGSDNQRLVTNLVLYPSERLSLGDIILMTGRDIQVSEDSKSPNVAIWGAYGRGSTAALANVDTIFQRFSLVGLSIRHFYVDSETLTAFGDKWIGLVSLKQ
jgi:hypothetical protein